ncbi:fimbrial protein [Herbaspirillum sp. RV1423]|uniref:fimbrial protein n=1 Tax=Herbaspirillum sp. RV1423 TaxID=1443993 RepID=UPI0004B3215A|nr:fimbrial protein [Herbaspirillum sp. RV1423]
MKKLILASLFSAAGLVSVTAQAVNTISFNGAVTDATCTVTTGTLGDFSVVLPTLSAAELNSASGGRGTSGFQIDLTGCTPASGNVRAFFNAGPTVNTAGRLTNTAAAAVAAKNVEIQLSNVDGSVINAFGGKSVQNAAQFPISSTGTATMFYKASYYPVGTVTSGAVNSSVVYSLDFN